MIVTNKCGEKIYGVTNIEEHESGKIYMHDINLAAGEFIEENLDVLQEMIADFKGEQNK